MILRRRGRMRGVKMRSDSCCRVSHGVIGVDELTILGFESGGWKFSLRNTGC